MTTSVEVTRITSENSDAVAAFYRKAWGSSATGDVVRRSRAEAARLNPTTPGADVPAVAYLREGEVIGHLGTIPTKFWNGKVEIQAHWLKGFMVLPEYQNGPVGYAILRELLKHVGTVASMVVAPAARRLLQAVGFVDYGVVPNYVCLLEPRRVARHVNIDAAGVALPHSLRGMVHAAQRTEILGYAVGAAAASVRAVGRLSTLPRRLITDCGNQPSKSSIDDLWVRARPDITAAAVRDGAMMQWHYAATAARQYETVTVRESAGRLVAVALVRRSEFTDSRLNGLRVMTISDLLFEPKEIDAGVAALAGAERAARAMGADALVCSTAHPAMTTALRRRAFWRQQGNLHLLVRDKDKGAQLPTAIEAWWLTRGDGNADESF